MRKQKNIKQDEIIFPNDEYGRILKYVYENGTDNLKYYIKYNSNPSIEWTTGGISGGNCYGDKPEFAVSGESEPEFEDFDDILLLLNPQISFLQYKKLKSTLISSKNTGYNDYYGNHTDSSKKEFNINEMIKYLYDKNLVTVSIPA